MRKISIPPIEVCTERVRPLPPPPVQITPSQDLAEADAGAFVEESDGMFARVETPSTHLVRVWIGVKPWRLYEGLGSRTVEALGLDPSKGVMVREQAA